uniref:CCHC-type domain-containing protein n=1 Tax=Solanum tuberosum TaxID=4113 RepID=M1DQD6_SOLTU
MVDQEVPSQAPSHALIYPLTENVTNTKFRLTFQVLAQAMTAQANREVESTKASGQGSSNAPKYNEDGVSNPKRQGISSESIWPTYARCGNRYEGRCLAGIEDCFSCGESGHKMRNCPKAKAKERKDYPKQKWFYALQTRGDNECAPNVDPGGLLGNTDTNPRQVNAVDTRNGLQLEKFTPKKRNVESASNESEPKESEVVAQKERVQPIVKPPPPFPQKF